MITRFDHAVLAAQDLADAGRLFSEELGFTVYPGGRHTGLGTENAIVRFGLDYLEILGIYDRDEVAAAGVKRASLLDFLATREGGMLGYCLATDDIDALAARFVEKGLEALGPYPMQRMRPDGVLLEWQLLVPGGTAWRRPWPFFIQWGMDDADRLALERPGEHANGAHAVGGLSMVVQELEAAKHLYSEQIGLPLAGENDNGRARGARYALGRFTIDLLAPYTAGPEQDFLTAHSEGLYQVYLDVQDREATAQTLGAKGFDVRQEDNYVYIPAERILGAELRFRQFNTSDTTNR